MCSENQNSVASHSARIKSGNIKLDSLKRRVSVQSIKGTLTKNISLKTTKSKNDSNMKLRPIQTNETTNAQQIVSNNRTDQIELKVKENSVEIFGDHKTLLNGAHMLETINKLEISGSLAAYSEEDILYLWKKKSELQSLLKLKCKLTIKNQCLVHLRNANILIPDLISLYNQENSKLAVIKDADNETQKNLVFDNFVKSSVSRKVLAEEIDQKINTWNITTNADRLSNVTHIFPKDYSIDLIVEKTMKEINYLRVNAIYWLRMILQTNIEIMCLVIDSLPFDCISNMCKACQSFNKLFASKQFETLDLLNDIAAHQSKFASNKLLYFIHNEVSNNIDPSLKSNSFALCNLSNNQSKEEEITSDYYSASSSSTSNRLLIPKSHKDLICIINMLVQENQRILLKLIFGHQENPIDKQVKTSWGRPKWFIIDDSVDEQQRLSQQYDLLFWQTFWSQLVKEIESVLCFANTNIKSISKCVLYDQTNAAIINKLLEQCFCEEELIPEAINSLDIIQHNFLRHISLQKWSENYRKVVQQMEKQSLFINDNNDKKVLGTTVGIDAILTLEPLIAMKIKKCSNNANNWEMLFDWLLQNSLNIFVSWIEWRQTFTLDSHLLSSFIAVSVLDINNLREIISMLNTKWSNVYVKNLQSIKFNAIIKVKHYMYHNSYQMISRCLPWNDYKKKISPNETHWMEKLISLLLEPSVLVLIKYQSVDGIEFSSNLIDEFAKALHDNVNANKKFKFSPLGVKQFEKDIEVFWNWMQTHGTHSLNTISVAKLKTLCQKISDKHIVLIKLNRVRPVVNQTNNFSTNSQQNNIQYNPNFFTDFLCFKLC